MVSPASLPALPVTEAVPALRCALAGQGCAVLAAPPGSGKTTLLPLLLLDEPWLEGRRIVMLEPRRVAARAAAARMASLLGQRVGETVGYQIRFERRISPRTRIEVVTEGLLTRRLQADAELSGVGLIVFDEFHERSLDADLALALTLEARGALRPDLRVLVMSATLDTQRVTTLLDRAPVIESGGRMFPVDIRYAPPRADVDIGSAVADGVTAALQAADGDVLAFLPGGREIREAQRRLAARCGTGTAIFPLYGDLSSAEQDVALQPLRDGRRKVILATNIAQTSLTVEGVTAVVDCGWARVARFDLGAGASRLETQRISRAAADQRAGRAGRLGPGVAWRLWSRDQHAQLPPQDTPEILVADLSRFALELATWGATPDALPLLDAPPAANWNYAQALLRAVDAVDGDGRITAHGRALARLPTAPRLAHMLLAARELGLADAAAWIAATLDERDASTDLAAAVTALRRGRADPAAQRRAGEAVRQFLRLIDAEDGARGSRGADEVADAGRLVALAFPERIARRRTLAPGARDAAYLCVDGGEARIAAADALAAQEWLAIAHWEPGPPRRIRLAAAADFADIEQDHAAHIETADTVFWDGQSEAVVAERQRRFGAIVLQRKPLRESGGEAVRAAMLEGLCDLGLQALPWSDGARQWQARVLSLRAWRPQDGWPDVSDAALAATMADWLGPYLDGITRRDHLARLDLPAILNSMLDYPQQQRLAQLAPTHLQVPSGSRVALEYAADGAPPVLAVKLQELFGLTQTPAVDDGRRPVMLHLLSPARRPIQVTQDLAGFWQRTYAEVKKELKGRYPRHPWPDDPMAAPPTARTVRRSPR
jgi:ATP-dependent helicase HrpB